MMVGFKLFKVYKNIVITSPILCFNYNIMIYMLKCSESLWFSILLTMCHILLQCFIIHGYISSLAASKKSTWYQYILCIISIIGKLSPNPYLKKWFRPIVRNFHEKNGPNSPDFEKKLIPITKFLLLILILSQICWKILILPYFHINTRGQIWLNHFGNDSHLGYITKLEKETLILCIHISWQLVMMSIFLILLSVIEL
jgi:hypothetical protein